MPLPSCFENLCPQFFDTYDLLHCFAVLASLQAFEFADFLRKSLHSHFWPWKPCIKKITSPGKSQETKNFPRFHSCESIDADTYAVYTAGDNANQRAMLLYSHSQLPDALPVSLHEASFQPGPALSDISCDSTLSVQSLFEAFFIVWCKNITDVCLFTVL